MISIVVIGKNEANNLPKLYRSLEPLGIQKEIIYVDSASSDASLAISQHYADRVIQLKDSPNLCAAAGRYVGTLHAKYRWILFLDGDMELEADFVTFLNAHEFEQFDGNIAGFIGYYRYIYNDGSESENRLLQPKNKVVSHFGGAVLLQKEILLQAGNWNPSVVANEEIDLYVRIQNLGFDVFGVDKAMVKHSAKKESNLHTLVSLFFPLNRRFYGFGQVLISQYKHKTLLFFIRKMPYPFLMSFILLGCFYLPYVGIFSLLVFIFFVSLKKRWHYNLIYLSDILRGTLGIFTYKSYTPEYELL